LHFIDNLGSFGYIFLFAPDYQIGLPSRDLNAKRLAQKAKVGIGGPKQLNFSLRRS
jgi:hypothetical protein